MCHTSCIDFIRTSLSEDEVAGRTVLEVGSYDVNGSVRPIVATMNPLKYLGVDIATGPGVDFVCSGDKIVKLFGENAFDILISTEMLEHVKDWQAVISNFKNVIKPGGLLLLTTRSFGFGYHGYPYDFWRYETSDFRKIFSDFQIECIKADPMLPGVFLKAKKPLSYKGAKASDIVLFSMITETHRTKISIIYVMVFRLYQKHGHLAAKILPPPMKKLLKVIAAFFK